MSSTNDGKLLTQTLVKALRIIQSQLQLLSLDMINFNLHSLRGIMQYQDQGIE